MKFNVVIVTENRKSVAVEANDLQSAIDLVVDGHYTTVQIIAQSDEVTNTFGGPAFFPE